jgi:glutamate-1-semialdehyde 2,1-aminomutase
MTTPYSYTASRTAIDRALKVIPSGIYGHQGPTEGCYIPQSAFPLFSSRAEGSRFWDADGNEYIDYMCGYGPNVLGYGDPDVEAAASTQRALEDVVSIPSTIMVDFAELLVDTVASADWAFFAKNGGDVTTLAVMTARAATRRKKIVFVNGFYHGVAPWTQKLDYPGVLEEEVANNLYVDFNGLPALDRLLRDNRGQIAGLIAQPYMHGNSATTFCPPRGTGRRCAGSVTSTE